MPEPAGFAEAVGKGADAAGEAAGGGGEGPRGKLLSAFMATEPNPPVSEVAEKWDVEHDIALAIRGGQKVLQSLFGTGIPAGEPAILDFGRAGLGMARNSGGDDSDDEPTIAGMEQ